METGEILGSFSAQLICGRASRWAESRRIEPRKGSSRAMRGWGSSGVVLGRGGLSRSDRRIGRGLGVVIGIVICV